MIRQVTDIPPAPPPARKQAALWTPWGSQRVPDLDAALRDPPKKSWLRKASTRGQAREKLPGTPTAR